MEQRKSQRCIYLLPIVLLAGIAAFFHGCGGDDPRSTGPVYKEVLVARGVFQILVTANGVVIPIDRVEIKSKASGEVVELPVGLQIAGVDDIRTARLTQDDVAAVLDKLDDEALRAQRRLTIPFVKEVLQQP
jgi:hypothetical protein